MKGTYDAYGYEYRYDDLYHNGCGEEGSSELAIEETADAVDEYESYEVNDYDNGCYDAYGDNNCEEEVSDSSSTDMNALDAEQPHYGRYPYGYGYEYDYEYHRDYRSQDQPTGAVDFPQIDVCQTPYVNLQPVTDMGRQVLDALADFDLDNVVRAEAEHAMRLLDEAARTIDLTLVRDKLVDSLAGFVQQGAVNVSDLSPCQRLSVRV